ncbi:lipocalin-15 isoform 2-T2 [Glossophaga mutica]
MQCQRPKTGAEMKSVLLGRVLALLWVSAACADVLVQPDFEAKKVFEEKKDHLLMSSATVTALPGGNLSIHMEVPTAEGCNRRDAEYLKVGSEGHFRAPALGYLDVRVVDTDYRSFAVLYIYKELEGALSTMVQLYSRTPEVSPHALRAFQGFYPTVGLQDDMMVTLPKSDACSSRCKGAP